MEVRHRRRARSVELLHALLDESRTASHSRITTPPTAGGPSSRPLEQRDAAARGRFAPPLATLLELIAAGRRRRRVGASQPGESHAVASAGSSSRRRGTPTSPSPTAPAGPAASALDRHLIVIIDPSTGFGTGSSRNDAAVPVAAAGSRSRWASRDRCRDRFRSAGDRRGTARSGIGRGV